MTLCEPKLSTIEYNTVWEGLFAICEKSLLVTGERLSDKVSQKAQLKFYKLMILWILWILDATNFNNVGIIQMAKYWRIIL